MYNILTLNKISASGLTRFDSTAYRVGDAVEAPDGIIVRSAAMHDYAFAPETLAVARAGAGVNNIPLDVCTEKGIVVFNTPGANANAVKEMVLCGLLICSRKVCPAIDWCKTLKGEGEQVPKLVEKGKSAFVGPEILGKKLGVIGMGAIGVLVAGAANALGMDVLAYDPFFCVDNAPSLAGAVKQVNNIDDIYAQCDYITLHLPLNADTKGMINAEAIAKMKDGVRILNFARGELVKSADLLAATEIGKVAAYVTDFPDDAVIGGNGVVAIPHLGASTPESEENCAEMAARELADFLESGNIVNSVNFPNVELPMGKGTRIALMHGNIPNMINIITSTFTEENVNIENMVNKSKGNIAYTLIDTDCGISPHTIDAIKAIEGVIRVRVIK